MNTAEQLAAALETEGVKFVFGLPGDENLPFVEAVASSSQLEFVLTRHEAAAGFMAAAHGHVTGKLAVVMSTLGAGATNLATPVAHAWLAESPMLVITGQKPILDNTQGRYQLVDVVDLMKPITKMAKTVESPASLPATIAEAVQTALEYPQGPVHIELPVDIAAETAGIHPLLAVGSVEIGPAPKAAISEAIALLNAAEHPLIVLGASANSRHDVAPAVRDLIERTGIPFICTMMGKGVGDEMSEQYLGTAGMPGMGFPKCAVEHSDLVLSVGHNVMEKAPFNMDPDSSQRVVHIHDQRATPDTIWFPQYQVVGDMAGTIAAIADAVSTSMWELGGFGRIRQAAMAAVMAEPTDPVEGLVKPQHVARAIRSVMGPNDIISLDNGIHKLWMTRNYPALAPRTTLVDSALGSMGTGIPAAIAAKLIYPERRVAAVVGDGGFAMTSHEIETACRSGLDLVVVIFNDGALGMIRLKQMRDGFQTHGVDFSNPDIVALGAAYGATGHSVTNRDELSTALVAAFETGGVHLIDVAVDYGENPKLMAAMMSVDCAEVLGE